MQGNKGFCSHLMYSFRLLAKIESFQNVSPPKAISKHQVILRDLRLSHLRISKMPTIVEAFKTVAASLIQVLTLLLQVMMQHMEVAPAVNPNAEAPVEFHAQMQAMLDEMHSQRAILENILQQNKTNPKTQMNPHIKDRKLKSGASPSMTANSSGTGIRPTMPIVGTSTTPMAWCLAESDEEVIVEEEEIEVTSSRAAFVARPQPSHQKPIEECGPQIIGWGKKHKGKTFDQVLQQDPGYLEWCQRRFMSLTPEMQEFVRYGQLKMSQEAAEASAAEI